MDFPQVYYLNNSRPNCTFSLIKVRDNVICIYVFLSILPILTENPVHVNQTFFVFITCTCILNALTSHPESVSIGPKPIPGQPNNEQ